VRSFPPLPPDRGEYEAFEARQTDDLGENYIPFAVHRLRLAGSGEDVLVVCRWARARFPLPVAIEAPELDDDLDGERLAVEFVGPPEMRIYVADQYGLLTPEQVETVAAHELGRALGIRGHSPFPMDLMHEVARDRLGDRRLSGRDVSTVGALYALPNGTVHARREEGEPPEPRRPEPPGSPRLAAPQQEPALGVQVRWPEGWRRLDIDHGVAVVDGLAWGHDASLQIVLLEDTGVDAYLARYADAHFGAGPMLEQGELRVGGRPGLRFVQGVPGRGVVEELVLLDLGDDRLPRLIAEAPRPLQGAYAEWFETVLASIAPTQDPPTGAGD